MKKAVIFANGSLPDPAAARLIAAEGDLMIAADGGFQLALSLGVTPHSLVGDLDSTSKEDLDHARASGIELELFPREKDETDLELALRRALDAGCESIRIIGGLGGRTDQALANLLLLADPALESLDVRLDDGLEEAFAIRRSAAITGSPGDTVSLLPLGGPALGIETEGLRYPLQNETLLPFRTRGVSNEMTGPLASVRLKEGLLLCIHRR